ncbi:MAG: hypothetical protein D6736_19755 [Nitrospinota bacterium]|nr:MAG: hypothetical protein D6736_19755 [Nitrospinota bacterium]
MQWTETILPFLSIDQAYDELRIYHDGRKDLQDTAINITESLPAFCDFCHSKPYRDSGLLNM